MLRKFFDRIIFRIRNRSAEWRTLAFITSVIVVFSTTYSMILPAITLSSDSAAEAAGIYMEEAAAAEEEYESYDDDAYYEENLPAEETVPETGNEGDVYNEEQAETEGEDEGILPEEEIAEETPDNETAVDETAEETADPDGSGEQPESIAPAATEGTTSESASVSVASELSESAAENASVSEEFLAPEELIEDGRYIIVRYGDDGNSYAMNKDGIAVPVVYDPVNNTAYCEDEGQDIVWNKEGYVLRSNHNTYIKLDVTTEDTPAVSDEEAWLSAEKPDEGQFSAALYRRVMTDDVPKYYALVLSQDRTFFTTTIIDTKPVKRTILAKEAALSSPESAAEPIMEEDKTTSSVESVAEPVLTSYEAGSVNVPVEGADYTIQVSFGADACIPGDAEFKAVSLDQQEEYAEYAEKAVEAAEAEEQVNEEEKKSSEAIGVFDLTIYDAAGQVIQPAAPVSVSVNFGEALAAETEVCAVHFQGTGVQEEPVDDGIEYDEIEKTTDTRDPAVIDAVNEDGSVSFEADSFSVYVIVGKETIITNYITAEGDTYTITVTYDKNAEIPDGATLDVKEIVNGDKNYTDYVEQAAKALTEGENIPFVNAARLFDISIIADGKKVEPKAPVEVKIEYANAENLNKTSEVGAVHFKKNAFKTETEVINVEVQGGEGKVDGVTFTTDSFSIYAVVIIDTEEGSFVFEDDDYKVTVTYTKEAIIPIGTELKVESIDPSSTQYSELWKETLEKINEGVEWKNPDEPDPRKGLTDAVFFDITLNYQGKKFEPEVPLGVKIECKNGGILTPPGEENMIVHFADQGTELIPDVQTESIEQDMPYLTGALKDSSLTNAFAYEQNGFSIVGGVSTGEYVEINENNISGLPLQLMAAPVRASTISASKTVEDTDGDGVYEMALSVTGASESSSSTKVDKSNVVIVVDVSGSMSDYVYSAYTYSADTYDANTTYYGIVGNTTYSCIYWPGGIREWYDWRGNYHSQYYSEGWYYGNNWTAYRGTVYIGQTRLEATKGALHQLVDALLENNRPDGTVAEDGTKLDDIIEITLIKFADPVENTYQGWNGTRTLISNVNTETEKNQLHTIIDDLWAGGGTDWELALQLAKTEADTYERSQTGESESVIFLTDGVPTMWGTNPNNGGEENRNNTRTGWNAASDDARAIVESGYTLYNIFSYGTDTTKYDRDDGRTDADYLRSLTNYAYTGSGTYANTDITQYVRDYFFNAKDTTALTEAFRKIISNINNEVGYGGVDYEDGVTLGVTNTSVTVDGTVHDETFRYTVRNGNNIVYSVKIDDGVATFTIPGKEGTYTDNTPETVTTKIDENDESTWITSTVYSVEVDGKTYAMSPALINKDTGLVDWDLAGLGILENGYTYTVAFDVWPNQYSYDLVADLNNGLKTLDQIKAELIKEYGTDEGTALYNQIIAALQGPDANGQYSILTNWKQEVSYYTVDTTTDDQGNESTVYTPHDPKILPNPDPIALTSKPLPMRKIWNSNLSPDQIGNLLFSDYPTNSESTEYQVTLHLWKADTANELQSLINQYAGNPTTASANDYIEKTLGWNGTAYDWEDSVSIAPGTMVSLQTAIDMGIDTTSAEHQKNIVTYNGAQYYIIEKGHYYYVTEDNIDWHFELETVLYHPMMVNGRLKNVTFITDEAGNITGVEDIEDMTQVTATNSKTAELDITKKVVDNTGKMTQAQMDAETFTYKVTLTVPKDADMSHTNALEWVARYNDSVSAANRYYVYGYQTSEDAELLGFADDVERFNGKVYGQYTVSYPGGSATLDEIFTNDPGGATKSGTIYVTLKQNEIIRFTNLPSDTQYTIEEIYNNLYQADASLDADANLGENVPASNVEANGYTVTIATKNGEPTVSGRVVTGTIDKLNKRYYNQFTNTLNDTAVVDLDVTKHLQGYEWTGDKYYVKLAAADENTPLPRITTRYLSAASGTDDVTFNFGSVHLKPGTYTYTITETASDYTEVYSGKVVNGVTYDAVKTIKVTVANDLSVSIAEGSSEGVTFDSTTNTVKTKVTNKVLPISLYKIGDSNPNNALSNVKFELYSDQACTKQVKTDARGNKIRTDGVLTTGNDGSVLIGILNTGTYYLKEIATQPGYNTLTELISVTVAEDGMISYSQESHSPSKKYNSKSDTEKLVKGNRGLFITGTDNDGNATGYTITVNNTSGVELPHTGGPGTLSYLLSGIALMLGAALMYIFGLRRREMWIR